jgi:hypothetical protein
LSLVTHMFGGKGEMHDWKRFFNHIPDNLNQSTYRIFEPESRIEILNWFSRKDILKAQKDEFIKALIDFDNGHEEFDRSFYLNFYKYRAYFLAAEALAYFTDSSYGDAVVEQLLKWSYVYFGWQIVPKPLQKAARDALKITDKKRVIQAFTTLLHTTTSRVTLRHAAVHLGKFDAGNKTAIAALILLLEVTKSQYEKAKICQSLSEIASGNKNAIASICQVVKTLPNPEDRDDDLFLSWCEDCEYYSYQDWYINYGNAQFSWLEVEALGKIGIGNKDAIPSVSFAIAALETFLQVHQKDDSACFDAVRALWQINPGNSTAISSLLQIIATTQYSFMLAKSAKYLLQISPENSDAIAILSKRLQTDNYLHCEAALYLGLFNPGNIIAVNALKQLINSKFDLYAFTYLLQIAGDEEEVIDDIHTYVENCQEDNISYKIICELLRLESYKLNKIALEMLLNFIETTTNKTYCSLAIHSLGEVICQKYLDSKMHQNILAKITQFLIKNQGDDICVTAAETLIYLEPDNEIAINTCVEAIHINRNQYVREQAATNLLIANYHCNLAIETFLEAIYQGDIDKFSNRFLLNRFRSSIIDFIYHKNLTAAFKKYHLPKLVTALKPYFSNQYYRDIDFPDDVVYNLMRHCAQNMNYLDFHQAWHNCKIS